MATSGGSRESAQVHEVDLADEPSVSDVVSLVRPRRVHSSQSSFPEMVRTNVLGTIHLVEACLRVGFDTLVNSGSSSEYAFHDHALSEDEEPRPSSDYAVTKLTATLYCSAPAARSRHSIPTLRLYSVYGPAPFVEPSRLMPRLAVKGIEGTLPPLASPHVAGDLVYVDVVVEAYLASAAPLGLRYARSRSGGGRGKRRPREPWGCVSSRCSGAAIPKRAYVL